MAAKVVVLGSVNVDLLVSAARLPRAGETVAGDKVEFQLGGKGANQAVAAARAGAPTILIGAVGDDDDGAAMLAELRRYGVNRFHDTPERRSRRRCGKRFVAAA